MLRTGLIMINTHAHYSLHCAIVILRISQAVKVTDQSESSVIMVTPKGEYVIRKEDSENFMRPVQESNPSVSAELAL